MAEVTAFRNNAGPQPQRGAAFACTFPIYDADGDLVTGAAGLDSERSKNGDTFADCTNEATEIATSSGIYYLLLTASETDCDILSVIVKTSTVGAKTTVMVFYPRAFAIVRSGTSQGAADTSEIILDSGASAIDGAYAGMIVDATIDSNSERRIITSYVGSTKTATVDPDFNVQVDNNDTFIIFLPDGGLVANANVAGWLSVVPNALQSGRVDSYLGAVAAGVIAAGSFAAGAFDAVWTVTVRVLTAATNLTTALATPTNITAGTITTVSGNVNGSVGSVTAGVTVTTNNDKTGYSIGVGGIGATAFAAGAIDSAALADSAGQDIADQTLNRNIAGGGSGNTRNVRNALRAIRNKVDGSTGTLTVYEEDDTTPAWTAALTRTGGTDPITIVDP